MDLIDYGRMLRRHALVAVVTFVLCVALALAVLPPRDTYRATAVLAAQPRAVDASFSEVAAVEFMLPTLEAIAESDAMLAQVSDSNSVPVSEFDVEADIQTGTGLLSVSVDGPSSDALAVIANGIAEELIDMQRADSPVTLTIIEPAEGSHPAGPPELVVYLAIAVFATIAAILAALLAQAWRRKIVSARELERHTGVPVVARTSAQALRAAQRNGRGSVPVDLQTVAADVVRAPRAHGAVHVGVTALSATETQEQFIGAMANAIEALGGTVVVRAERRTDEPATPSHRGLGAQEMGAAGDISTPAVELISLPPAPTLGPWLSTNGPMPLYLLVDERRDRLPDVLAAITLLGASASAKLVYLGRGG